MEQSSKKILRRCGAFAHTLSLMKEIKSRAEIYGGSLCLLLCHAILMLDRLAVAVVTLAKIKPCAVVVF